MTLHPHDPRWAYALTNLAAFLWGTNFVLGRLLRADIGPATLTLARFAVAGLVFAWLLRRAPPPERRPGAQWPWLLAMGLTGVVGFTVLLYTGLKFTTAVNAGLINGVGPLVIGLMAALFLREQLTPRMIAGAFVSLAGVAVIAGDGSLESLLQLQLNFGDVLVFGGCWPGACTRCLGGWSRAPARRWPPAHSPACSVCRGCCRWPCGSRASSR